MPTFAGYFGGSAAEGNSSPTPYISTERTSQFTEPLQIASAQADEQPLRYLRARAAVEKALSRIDHAREQGADWDDEEGESVSFPTAKRAKDLLIDAALRAEIGGKAWTSPAISATPEGGIHLSWLVSSNRVALTVFAPYRDTVCVSKLHGGASQRELLSDFGAVERVLQALSK